MKSKCPDKFLLRGFSAPYRLNRSSKGGGMLLILLYIRQDVSSRLLGDKSKTGIEIISVEINWKLIMIKNKNK